MAESRCQFCGIAAHEQVSPDIKQLREHLKPYYEAGLLHPPDSIWNYPACKQCSDTFLKGWLDACNLIQSGPEPLRPEEIN